jgi:broad specificity phosphatase PhoE
MAKGKARSPGVFDRTFLIGVDEVTEVLLIRHAQQHIDSLDGATVGDWIDPPLSEHGRMQAAALGSALSTLNLDAVFVSPLKRAMETAEAVARHHRLELQTLDDLREVEIFRDLPGDVRAAEFLGDDLLEAVRLRMLNERSWDVYPHSEPSAAFRKRAINAVETAIARHAAERIAIVCHGGVINAYVGHIIGSAYDMFFRPAHTSINTIVAGEGRRVLRHLNDAHHLRTPEGELLSY